MYLNMLKSKIHGGRVTDANVNYEGSVTIDAELLKTSGIREFEKVAVVSLDTGHRLETYAINGPPGSGLIQTNGAAAHVIKKGEQVIIMAYAGMDEAEARYWRPRIIHLDALNKPKSSSYASVN